MTVGELRARLADARDDAAVLVVDPYGDPFPIGRAAVYGEDDVEYTQLPGSPGSFVISLVDDEELSR